jgi:uncharacterized protein (TIGR00661 family)
MQTFKLSYHQGDLPENGRILVAPLNWGIGHATRCIPIINQLIEGGYKPVIASDGEALQLLQKVFPKLKSYRLPAYKVRYTKNSWFFKLKILRQFPHLYKTYKQEQLFIADLLQKDVIDAIISDNRFGVFSKEIFSIYITHQLRVKSGFTTFLTGFLHRRIFSKFDKIWIPDVADTPNLSGVLSHQINLKNPMSYIGLLSQFKKEIVPKKYDILVLLSGPEPQRTILEKQLFKLLKNSDKEVCFIKGKVSDKVEKQIQKKVTVYNFLFGVQLQRIINQSELVIARSGYSTIMDLAVLQKKAFFIPTPGQDEQLYLAKHLAKQKVAPFSCQRNFTLRELDTLNEYKGF